MGAAAIRPSSRSAPPGSAERVLAHMVSVIQAADVHDEPYSHLYVGDVFPTDFYGQLLNSLPDPALYQPLNLKAWARPDGESTRDRFLLTTENVDRLPHPLRQVWATVTGALSHAALKRVVFRKLAKDLMLRFGVDADRVAAIETHPRMLLFRDTDQYRIRPHPDGLETVVTMGFYLPPDLTQQELGTSLYEQRSRWSRLLGGPRFEEVKRLPFRPNSAYAFVVNNLRARKSWHGVELVPGGSGVRNTILNRYVGSQDDAAY